MRRINTSILSVIVLALLSTSFSTPPQVRASETPATFNLNLDANGDGIPDELADAVAAVGNTFTLAQSDGVLSSTETNAMEQDLVNLDARLPYAPETRSLQQRVATLNAQIADATPEQAAAINAEIVQLSEQMLADPNYARTIAALTKLLAPDLSAGAATRYQVYLPMVTGGANNGAGVAASTNPPGAHVAWWWDRPRVSWSNLRRGNIMFQNSGDKVAGFAYALEFNHAGTYDGNNLVYESNPNDGVNMRRLANWQANNLYIGLGRNNQKSEADVTRALDWAKSYYGTNGRTRYNWWFPDKWTDKSLYCSQLVWKIHGRAGSDLDSNDWGYFVWFVARWSRINGILASAFVVSMVAPDEIARSSRVSVYSKGWTN